MSKNKFIELLERNFSPDEFVAIGLNKKWVNQSDETKRFARDFDQVFMPVKAIPDYVKSMRDKADLYLCFTPLEAKQRTKDKAKETYIIAQDIDGVKFPEDLPPSYYWETSPNKHQGIWLLDNPVKPETQEKINRALISRYGFDKTSADVVHFYRIPLTINHKYKTPFKVSGLQGDGTVYRTKDLIKKLKAQEVVTIGSTVKEDIDDKRFDLDELLDKYDAQSRYDKWLPNSDRSDYSYQLSLYLVKQGCTKEELRFVLLNLPDAMAKWTFSTVNAEVHRIFAKVDDPSDQSRLDWIKMTGKNKFKQPAWGNLTLTKLADVEELDTSNQWLVEDVWANNSVGIIGAPPKSFKSTLVTNLVLSVASGEPFCGKKVSQGGVIMVLGESNAQAERQKMYDIVGDDILDLPIYFVDQQINIDDVSDLEDLIKENDIKLLVLDPLYMLIGEDLNKQKEVTHALKSLTTLRDATNCSIMLVHHSKKIQRGERIRPDDLFGTTFINGWYESLILLQRNGTNTSVMKTYFRNHISGTKYTLHIHPATLKAEIHLIPDEDEWTDVKQDQASFEIKTKVDRDD